MHAVLPVCFFVCAGSGLSWFWKTSSRQYCTWACSFLFGPKQGMNHIYVFGFRFRLMVLHDDLFRDLSIFKSHCCFTRFPFSTILLFGVFAGIIFLRAVPPRGLWARRRRACAAGSSSSPRVLLYREPGVSCIPPAELGAPVARQATCRRRAGASMQVVSLPLLHHGQNALPRLRCAGRRSSPLQPPVLLQPASFPFPSPAQQTLMENRLSSATSSTSLLTQQSSPPLCQSPAVGICRLFVAVGYFTGTCEKKGTRKNGQNITTLLLRAARRQHIHNGTTVQQPRQGSKILSPHAKIAALGIRLQRRARGQLWMNEVSSLQVARKPSACSAAKWMGGGTQTQCAFAAGGACSPARSRSHGARARRAMPGPAHADAPPWMRSWTSPTRKGRAACRCRQGRGRDTTTYPYVEP